jgi:rod shape-determining protein MreC
VALRAERSGSRADTAAFLLCLLLSLTALALPDALRVPAAAFVRETLLAPVLGLQRRSVLAGENRTRLEVLRAERDSLSLGAAFAPELAAENARLRGLLALGGRVGTGFVSAEVLHQAGVGDGLTLLLSAGSADGVQPLSAVVAPDGLVGLVRTVDRHTSVAIAWTHPDFRTSAMVDKSRVFGIVSARRGEREGELMELRGVAYRDQLAPGTKVVTSGLGGVFPRGVPVGTVQGVLSESAGWERTYLLRPAVHPAQATHVMVLHAQHASDDLSRVFADTAALDSAIPHPRRPQ